MAWRREQAFGQELRDRVLAACGEPVREVAEPLSVSPSYVVKVRARLRETGEREARGDGAEGAGADQRAHPPGAGGGESAWTRAGRRPRVSRPAAGPDAAAQARRQAAERAAHRLVLEVEAAGAGKVSCAELARLLTARGVPTPSGSAEWTHTTVARVLQRAAA
jgi:hypothetical protein